MSLDRWLIHHPLRWAPEWIQQWREDRLTQHLAQTLLPQLEAAQAAGAGVVEGWVPADAPIDETLQWCDAQIGSVPRLPGLEWLRVVVVPCTAAEWEQAAPMAPIQVIVSWDGTRTTWWAEGRERIAQALTPPHAGLCVAVSALEAATADILHL